MNVSFAAPRSSTMVFRNFPSFKLPLECDNVGTLTRETIDSICEPILLYHVTAKLHNPWHQATRLLQVLCQINTKHFLALELTFWNSSIRNNFRGNCFTRTN